MVFRTAEEQSGPVSGAGRAAVRPAGVNQPPKVRPRVFHRVGKRRERRAFLMVRIRVQPRGFLRFPRVRRRCFAARGWRARAGRCYF